jgi:nitrate reductase beta subunit
VAYLPTTCNHCDDAPCVKAGKGAVVKRDDGIVLIVPERARGRRDLVTACPYGAIWWNEEKHVPQAWPFDAHLIDQGWTQTRGAQVCPTGAMRSIKVSDADMARIAAEQELSVLHPEYGTRPRVYYRNLHRFEKAFLGGSLAAQVGGVEECVAGASVVLSANGVTISETESDIFGNFRFDRLDAGAYRVEIHAERFPQKTIDVDVRESVVLDTILL